MYLTFLYPVTPWPIILSSLEVRLKHEYALKFPSDSNGEGNGSPLQCSCLENPRDRGAWWAAVNGVAQSWT